VSWNWLEILFSFFLVCVVPPVPPQLQRLAKCDNQYIHGGSSTLEGRSSCLHSKVPEPPKFSVLRVFGPFPEVVKKQICQSEQSDCKMWEAVLTAYPPGTSPPGHLQSVLPLLEHSV